jgi:hypothetical protein
MVAVTIHIVSLGSVVSIMNAANPVIKTPVAAPATSVWVAYAKRAAARIRAVVTTPVAKTVFVSPVVVTATAVIAAKPVLRTVVLRDAPPTARVARLGSFATVKHAPVCNALAMPTASLRLRVSAAVQVVSCVASAVPTARAALSVAATIACLVVTTTNVPTA